MQASKVYVHGLCRCHIVDIVFLAGVNIGDGHDSIDTRLFWIYFSFGCAMTCSLALVGVERFILSIEKKDREEENLEFLVKRWNLNSTLL